MYLHTAKGPLAENEDCLLALRDPEGDAAVLVAADGLGGCGNGSRASWLAAHTIGEGFLRAPSLEEGRLLELFRQAHRAIRQEQSPGRGMKSTAAALFLLGGMAVAGHIGDTRLYRFSGGKLRWRSLDHSVPQLAVYAGEIGPDGIRGHPDRNRLLRALGGDSCQPQLEGPVAAAPGDAWLLCTDGFWEPVTEDLMERELAPAPGPREWIEGMLRAAEAQGQGWKDNYSAGAVFF